MRRRSAGIGWGGEGVGVFLPVRFAGQSSRWNYWSGESASMAANGF